MITNTKNKNPDILIVNQYYPPDTSATAKYIRKLTLFLSKEFKTKVLAGRPSYNSPSCHSWYLSRGSHEDGIDIDRIGSLSFSRFRMLGRVANYLSFMTIGIVKLLIQRSRLVIVFTDPPLISLMGAIKARLQKIPFIYFVQDLHPDMAIAAGLISDSTLINFWEKIHVWTLKQATKIVVPGNDMMLRLVFKGISPEKIIVNRHGSIVESKFGRNELRNRDNNKIFRLIHAGNIGYYGAWSAIVTAMRKFNNNKCEVVFVGEGAAKECVQSEAVSCQNIKFIPFQPEEDLPYLLKAGDVHILTIKNGMEGLVVPSKFYTILSAGRPLLVVANRNSEAAQLVKQFKCGIVAEPDDPVAITAAIKTFMNHPKMLKDMSENALSLSVKLEQKKQFGKFKDIVQGVLKASGA